MSNGNRDTESSTQSAVAPTPTPTPPSTPAPTNEKPCNEKPYDEKMFETFDFFVKERTRLSASKEAQAKAYDQTILTFSAGAVALSITFLEKVVKHGVHGTWWLFTSWIFFGLAMLTTLFSYLVSQAAFEGEIDDLEERYKEAMRLTEEEKNTPDAPRTVWGVTEAWLRKFAAMLIPTKGRAIKWLNIAAGLMFLAGVACFASFAWSNWLNIGKQQEKQETTPVATTTTTTTVALPRPKPGTGNVPDRGVVPPINPTTPSKGK